MVKEFVENAIDAGASHITVQVEGAGSRLIRVIDNGAGMDQDDVLLSLERHATSKLVDEAQLAAIATLGFRGEAIPSIASVTRMTITSRLHGAALGVRAEIRFGQVVRVHDMGCPPGTVMEVRDLFGNMPARKKFLKSAQTELAHIEEVVKNYALAYPKLGVAYEVDGREVFNLSAVAHNLEARVRQLACRSRYGGGLVRLGQEAADESGGPVKVHGYLLPPDQDVTGKAPLRLFVNGRAVRDRMIGHALAEGLRGFLMKGARPAGVLFIEVPVASVDVNVHPTKQEIRFQRPAVIHQQVGAAAVAAMERYQRSLKRDLFVVPEPPPRPAPLRRQVGEAVGFRQPILPLAVRTAEQEPSVGPSPPGRPVVAAPAEDRVGEAPAGTATAREPGEEAPAAIGFLRPVGQLLDAYILCQSEDGLVVIDQHAAHERLLFESLKKQFSARTVARQALLFPAVLELRPEEKGLIARYGAEIAALGVDIEPFGGDSYVVKAVPVIVAQLGAEAIVRDLLERFAAGSTAIGVRVEAVLASMACKAAIKAGDPLQEGEMVELLRQMREADVFSHCPHGRPVVKHFPGADIRRWFHRG